MPEEELVGDNGASARKVVKVNYPSNAHKGRNTDSEGSKEKPERKKQEKVISGEVVQRKKGLWGKVKETFTGDDLNSVGDFIIRDIVVPAIKQMISESVSQGVERSLFGGSTSSRSGSGGYRPRYTSYNTMSRSNPAGRAGGAEPDERRTISNRARSSHDFDDIVLETRGEAEEVLERLGDSIQNYDVATVSDLYDLVGISGSFTDEKWGWTDLRGAAVQRVRGGYLLNLPRTSPID